MNDSSAESDDDDVPLGSVLGRAAAHQTDSDDDDVPLGSIFNQPPDPCTTRTSCEHGTLLNPQPTQKFPLCDAAAIELSPAPQDQTEQLDTSHCWVRQRVLRVFGEQKISGVVTGWMPERPGDPELFHILHDDGECDMPTAW